jgi:hypothetical protein
MTVKLNAVNLSNENITLTCYLIGTSPNLKNAIVRPSIMVFSGGSFIGTSYREAEPVAMIWLAKGYNVFILRYTFGPPSERNTVIPVKLRLTTKKLWKWFVPMFEEVARQPSAVNISLSTLARHVPEQITPELLARIEEAAKGLF